MKSKTLIVAACAAAFQPAIAQAMDLRSAASNIVSALSATSMAVSAISATSERAQVSVGFPARIGMAIMAGEAGALGPIIRRHAATNGVPVALAHAVVKVESEYRPDARGRAGEVGLMQIKPATARSMGYRGSVRALFDPETNIRFGMKYLGKAYRLGGGGTCATILRYNAGHAAKRMNPVSRAYCDKVLAHLAN